MELEKLVAIFGVATVETALVQATASMAHREGMTREAFLERAGQAFDAQASPAEPSPSVTHTGRTFLFEPLPDACECGGTRWLCKVCPAPDVEVRQWWEPLSRKMGKGFGVIEVRT